MKTDKPNDNGGSKSKKFIVEAGQAILFLVGVWLIIMAVVWGLSAMVSNDKNSSPANPTKDTVIKQVKDDVDIKYSQLYTTTQKMMGNIDGQCAWLHDNVSKSVSEYCQNSLESLSDISPTHSASEYWNSDEIKYDENAPIANIVSTIVDESNTKYNELLQKAVLAQKTNAEQCTWLKANIGASVADYCSETTSAFNGAGFKSSPFLAANYQN